MCSPLRPARYWLHAASWSPVPSSSRRAGLVRNQRRNRLRLYHRHGMAWHVHHHSRDSWVASLLCCVRTDHFPPCEMYIAPMTGTLDRLGAASGRAAIGSICRALEGGLPATSPLLAPGNGALHQGITPRRGIGTQISLHPLHRPPPPQTNTVPGSFGRSLNPSSDSSLNNNSLLFASDHSRQ